MVSCYQYVVNDRTLNVIGGSYLRDTYIFSTFNFVPIITSFVVWVNLPLAFSSSGYPDCSRGARRNGQDSCGLRCQSDGMAAGCTGSLMSATDAFGCMIPPTATWRTVFLRRARTLMSGKYFRVESSIKRHKNWERAFGKVCPKK
ncbi:hypothetical protein AVEN_146331-1 [Araneus ventricosus]|uniref:Uncharacterized protein n=1 Tax=Araneus ventricosus TaxID=182803 RepID=A0A4Y2UVP9_ARAVE|nr:hypothetical protein AVEN_146331-1 [Araneus ventricosus]